MSLHRSLISKATSLSLLALSLYGGLSFKQDASTTTHAQTTPVNGVDLVITEVKVMNSSFKVGDPIKFAVTVKNQGTLATPTTWIGHSFYVDGTKVDWAGETTSLAAGASKTFVSNLGWTATKAGFSLKGFADDANNVSEANESNNTATATIGTTTTPSPTPSSSPVSTTQPDLKVTEVKVVNPSFKVGDRIQFAITVKNQGGVATPSRWLGTSFYVDGVKVDWAGQTASLGVGESKTFISQGWSATKTTFALKGATDDAFQIAEADEANNDLTAQVVSSIATQPSPSPSPSPSPAPTTNGADLVVSELKVVNPTFQVGDRIRFSITVKNQGATATPTSWLGSALYVDDNKVDWAGETTSIPAGGTKSFISTDGWTATKTSFSLKGLADDVNQVTESNKSNNTLSVQINGTTPAPAPTPIPTTIVPNAPVSGYKLVFQDEFNGSSLDSSKWMDMWPWNGRTNQTHFGNYYAADALAFSNGMLRIKQEKRSMYGYQYTSGMISTYGRASWTYGYFEMRAKLPTGRGMWPGFWLIALNSWPPEIDIFEMLGHEPNKLYLTNHWRDSKGNPTGYSFPYIGPDFSKDFHLYAMEWTPTSITWFVDGKEVYKTTTNIPQTAQYMLADVAVGGEWAGPPDSNTPFPQTMDIDYIRVFQK